MPRRKFQPKPEKYFPSAGTMPKPRPKTPGAAVDDAGRPIRILNYHQFCGAVIYRGSKNFDGFLWDASFHATRDGAELVKCPECLSLLASEDVTPLLPGEKPVIIPE